MHTIDNDYFDSEEFRDILSSYEAAAASGEEGFMDAEDLIDVADYYRMNGDDAKAHEVAETAHENNPAATLPNIFLAREALFDGDVELAKEYVASMEESDSIEYAFIQAEVLIAQELDDEADVLLRSAFRAAEPDQYEDFVMDAANMYLDYGMNEKAHEWMMRSKGNDSREFRELMARTLFGLGKYKDCERLFNELIDQDPYSVAYWNSLASAQFMLDDFSGAVTSSEYAMAIDPEDTESIINKANALYRLSNYEEAINYYERYMRLVPNDAFCLMHEGACYVNLERYDDALGVLQRAADAASGDSEMLIMVYQEIGFCYGSMGRVEEALATFDKLLKLDCDKTEVNVMRGHVLLQNERIREAEEEFRSAMSHADYSPSVILRIMVSLYDNKYVEASYNMFKHFFSVLSDFKDGYSYMALCCWDMGHKEEFLMYLRLAVERNPREARLVLGHLFPEGMAAKEYYDYMYKRMKA